MPEPKSKGKALKSVTKDQPKQAPASQPMPTPPVEPAAGVILGVYGWPELTELQIKHIRHHCGRQPILVVDDGSVETAGMDAVIGRYDGVQYERTPARLGLTGGELAFLHMGLQWARREKLRIVVKLSQRMLMDTPRWLQDVAAALIDAKLPIAGMPTTGIETYPLRTEAMALSVPAWVRPDVMQDLRPRKMTWEFVEDVVWQIVQDKMRGEMMPWELIGSDRYTPQAGVVWHSANPVADYQAIGALHDCPLPTDFHTGGWHSDPTGILS